MAWARARAYCSSANLGPGFDVISVALDAFYDEVEAAVTGEPGVRVVGVSGPYSSEAGGADSARLAAQALLERAGVRDVGLELRVFKGVPVARGLGSSGASAAAAVAAATKALGLNIDPSVLIEAAGEGERASAGEPHYDNVAASIMGGMVVVARDYRGYMMVESVDLEAWFALLIPFNPVPKEKTRVMREVLPKSVSLKEAVSNFGRAALMVAAAAKGNLKALGSMMSSDAIVEPRRSKFIPCYREVREAALGRGALGFAISGAGPATVALASSEEDAREIADAMREACSCCERPLSTVARVAGGVEVWGR